ncbi:MAG: hypothetical protein NVSMB6_14530 [Burkholderiaceae bacterium]
MQPWIQLRDADLRLGTLVYRLAIANNALCDSHESATGMVIQTLDQFPKDLRLQARSALRFETPVVVEAVVDSSPSKVAGLQPGDGIEMVNGQSLLDSSTNVVPSTAARDNAEDTLSKLPSGETATVKLTRNGVHFNLQFVPRVSCSVRSELVTDSGFGAQSDDKRIQIGIDYLARFDNDEIAALVAHELAHIILQHTKRLEAQGVDRGLLKEFGRNTCKIREAENEADRFSIWLLANAGFDPSIAPKFWRGNGRSISGRTSAGSTHDSARRRADAMDEQINLTVRNRLDISTETTEKFFSLLTRTACSGTLNAASDIGKEQKRMASAKGVDVLQLSPTKKP